MNDDDLDLCDRCHDAVAVVQAYWGPSLCRPCAGHVATLLDAHDSWPKVPWSDDDREVVG